MKVVISGLTIVVMFAVSAYSRPAELRLGETLVITRADGSALLTVATDNPVIRFHEVDGAVVAIRVTPIDRSGSAAGGGRLVMIGPNENREVRLRDEFAPDLIRDSDLRIEVLQGVGRVTVSSVDEFGRELKQVVSATPSRRRAVRPGRPPTPPSRALIDQAEAAGTIDSETALLYRVYDIFGDARLPQQYQGDDSNITEGMYLNEVRDRYLNLSAATRAKVMPFLIPPIYQNSWTNSARALPGISADGPPNCAGLDSTWSSVTTANGAVRIWYKPASGDLARAVSLSAAIDSTIWPALAGLMKNHAPLPDSGVPTCNGGDGRLDLYLTDIARSQTQSLLGCQNTPAFIEMNRAASDAIAIHELMHAFQFSYPLKACLGNFAYDWWTEGSATFAEDFVSPSTNEEQASARYFLDQPWESLDYINDFHEYGSYLLPFYVHRSTGNADFVSATWENCANEPALNAFDRSVSGGFEKVWFDFVRFNLNRKGFDDYTTWDGLLHSASLQGGEMYFSGGMDVVDPIDVNLPGLSALYKYYVFNDDEWSSVVFWNGTNFNLKLHESVPGEGIQYDATPGDAEATKGARVQALIKIGGKWTHEEWTGKPYVTFCRDVKSERIEALVVIISNSDFKDFQHRVKTGGGLLPVVFLSNMGCWEWTGTTTFSDPGGANVAVTATWSRTEQSSAPPFYVYQATGDQNWNYAGQCSGSGTLKVPTALSFLSTYNYAPVQSTSHRVSFGVGANTAQVLVQCKGDPASSVASVPDWLAFPPQPGDGGTGASRLVTVNANGKTMDGTYTFVDGSVWTWHFDAKSQ